MQVKGEKSIKLYSLSHQAIEHENFNHTLNELELGEIDTTTKLQIEQMGTIELQMDTTTKPKTLELEMCEQSPLDAPSPHKSLCITKS